MKLIQIHENVSGVEIYFLPDMLSFPYFLFNTFFFGDFFFEGFFLASFFFSSFFGTFFELFFFESFFELISFRCRSGTIPASDSSLSHSLFCFLILTVFLNRLAWSFNTSSRRFQESTRNMHFSGSTFVMFAWFL